MRAPVLVLSLAVLVAPVGADVIVVPDDHAGLEDAVAAAAPGDTILVRTTAEQGSFGVLIDKPLTIVGDPICNVDLRYGGLHLKGSGGAVTLVNVAIDYVAADENGYPSLWGGGFDELLLVGCRVVHENLAPSGLITSSYPAIDLYGEMHVTIVESDLMGGNAGAEVCAPPTMYQDGREAIYAPDATVVLVDSLAVGGNGGRDGVGGVTLDACCAACACPEDLSEWGGHGGDGVVARELHAWRSLVAGGEGIAWYAFPGGTDTDPQGPPVRCGEQADGMPYRVQGTLVRRALSPLYTSSTRPQLGDDWSLGWDPDALPACRPGESGCFHGAVAFLLASPTPPRRPLAVAGQWTYLDLATVELLAVFGAMESGEIELPVPGSLELVGVTVTAQVALSTRLLSGPVVGVLVP